MTKITDIAHSNMRLAAIARHFTKGKAQRRWDQEDRQHLHEVGQCGWVFKRMRRVGIKEATAVSTEHLIAS